jgi:hypothetical protein
MLKVVDMAADMEVDAMFFNDRTDAGLHIGTFIFRFFCVGINGMASDNKRPAIV